MLARLTLLALGAYAGSSIAIAWMAVCPKRHRIGESPTNYGMRSYAPVSFASSDGTTLRGWLVPTARPARGIVVLCHGIDGDRTSVLNVAQMLHRHGYCTLLFDFRARGESDGARCTLGRLEAQDVAAAVRFASSRPEAHGAPVAVYGHSMGAAAAIMAAAATPQVRAVVAESPFARLDHAVANHFRSALGTFGVVYSWGAQRAGERLIGASARDIAPVNAIGRIAPRPVLLIQDADDNLCPPPETAALLAASRGCARLWTVPHAGHVEAPFVAPKEFERTVAGFLDASLKQEPGRESP